MISDRVVEQILLIRDTGKYNMLDIPNIKLEAYVKGYYELVEFLEDHLGGYLEFIIIGKR